MTDEEGQRKPLDPAEGVYSIQATMYAARQALRTGRSGQYGEGTGPRAEDAVIVRPGHNRRRFLHLPGGSEPAERDASSPSRQPAQPDGDVAIYRQRARSPASYGTSTARHIVVTPARSHGPQVSDRPTMFELFADALQRHRIGKRELIGGLAALVVGAVGLYELEQSIFSPHDTALVYYDGWGQPNPIPSRGSNGTPGSRPNTSGNKAENWSPENPRGWRIFDARVTDPMTFLRNHVANADTIDYGYEFTPSELNRRWSYGDCWLYSTQFAVECLMPDAVRYTRPTMGRIGRLLDQGYDFMDNANIQKLFGVTIWDGAYQVPSLFNSYAAALEPFHLQVDGKVVVFAPTDDNLTAVLKRNYELGTAAILDADNHYFPALYSCLADGTVVPDGTGPYLMMGDSSPNKLTGVVPRRLMVQPMTLANGKRVHGFWNGKVIHTKPDPKFVRV